MKYKKILLPLTIAVVGLLGTRFIKNEAEVTEAKSVNNTSAPSSVPKAQADYQDGQTPQKSSFSFSTKAGGSTGNGEKDGHVISVKITAAQLFIATLQNASEGETVKLPYEKGGSEKVSSLRVLRKAEGNGRFTVMFKGEDYNGSVDYVQSGETYKLDGYLENRADISSSFLISGSAEAPIFTHDDGNGIICLGALAAPVLDLHAESIEDSLIVDTNEEAASVYNSNPGAPCVIYIDFDGETINPGNNGDTHWNDGDEIVAAASNLSTASQLAVCRRVTADFLPWKVTVTNSLAVFNQYLPQERLRVIQTPTKGWYGSNIGGIARVNSFDDATDLPCWSFNDNGISQANETISHEAGHTLGLYHDGNSSTGYYAGHGSGTTSWAPIMGVSYNKTVTHWSKGEYNDANQTQDDVAIITAHLEGGSSASGYVDDEAGDSPIQASAATITGTSMTGEGIIHDSDDVDLFAFSTGAGDISIQVNPFDYLPNLDIQAQLLNASGVVIATSNPTSTFNADINVNVDEGIYYLSIDGVGKGDVTGTGYSDYSSIGYYAFTGTINEVVNQIVVPPLMAVTMPVQTNSGASTLEFTVEYEISPAAISGVTLVNSSVQASNVSVTGPLGESLSVSLVSKTPSSGNATNVTATYAVSAPGGSWDIADAGNYTVTLNDQEVVDTSGVHVEGAQIGVFEAPRALYAMNNDVDPGWTLEGEWEWGAVAGNNGDPDSGYTGNNVIGTNLNGDYDYENTFRYATSPVISTVGYEDIKLDYRRILNAYLVYADFGIEYSLNSGQTWSLLWEPESTASLEQFTDGSWQHHVLSIPNAGGVTGLQIRFYRGKSILALGGWNIDDLLITGTKVSTPQLVAYYPMNETSGTAILDQSGNGYNAVLESGSYSTGRESGAVCFNGVSDQMRLPAGIFDEISNGFTLAMWVYGDATLQPQNDSIISASSSTGGRVLSIHLPWSNSKVYYDAGDGSSYDRIISNTVAATNYKGSWNHWMFTKDASLGTMEIYLNGALIKSETGKNKPMSGVTDFYLGSAGNDLYYAGCIDEVKIYNYSLSAAETLALYETYDTGYYSWIDSHIADNTDTDRVDDVDGDGIENILEYVLNGTPTGNDASILPVATVTADDFLFNFTRRSSSTEDTLQVFQYSSDLTNWTDVDLISPTASEVSVVEAGGGEEEDVTITLDRDNMANDGKLFGRLKVSDKE